MRRFAPAGRYRPSWTILTLGLLVLVGSGRANETPTVPLESATHVARRQLVIGGGDNYEPFHYLEDGEPTGFDVDLVRAIGRVMGLDIEVRLGYWQDIRDGLQDGSIDVHIGMTQSPDRADRYRFASPHLTQQYKIFIDRRTHDIRSQEDLHGKRIACQRDGVMTELVQALGYTDTPVQAASAAEALRMLALGEVDCCLMTEFRGLTVARDLGLDRIERVGRPLYQTTYGFAVAPAREDLALTLSQGLAILKESGEYARIYEKWFGVLSTPPPSPRDYLRVLAWVIVPLLVVFLLGALWTWSLRQQVVRQTAELRQARDEAEIASRAKSRFLAIVSHEIRTPLNGVLGMTQILSTSRLEADQREQVATIATSAHKLQDIINDILEFSRLDAGQRELDSVDLSLRDLVTEVVDTVAPEASRKGLAIQVDLAADLPDMINGDATAIRQILLALLANAVKFTTDGEVAFSLAATAQGDDGWRLDGEVADTGMGIDEDDREALFDAFTQVDSSSTRRHGGIGLGLAICRNLSRQMGGDLRHEPNEPTGSRFVFDLRVARVQAPAAAPAPPPDLIDGTRHDPVLVVEDNPTNQRVVGLLLRRWGFATLMVENGAEAVAAFERESFSAIIMDCQMPVMDGLEATERIRDLETGDRRVPIIALTAGSDLSGRGRCLAAGMDAYLTKPVNADRLRDTLSGLLASPPHQGETAPRGSRLHSDLFVETR